MLTGEACNDVVMDFMLLQIVFKFYAFCNAYVLVKLSAVCIVTQLNLLTST